MLFPDLKTPESVFAWEDLLNGMINLFKLDVFFLATLLVVSPILRECECVDMTDSPSADST